MPTLCNGVANRLPVSLFHRTSVPLERVKRIVGDEFLPRPSALPSSLFKKTFSKACIGFGEHFFATVKETDFSSSINFNLNGAICCSPCRGVLAHKLVFDDLSLLQQNSSGAF